MELETYLNLLHSIAPLIDIRFHLVKRVADSASSLHSSVAERAILLLHSPVLLCLVRQYKEELLMPLIDALQSNVHRNERHYINVLRNNGTFTQQDSFTSQ